MFPIVNSLSTVALKLYPANFKTIICSIKNKLPLFVFVTGFQLCLTYSIHPVHCRAVLIYWLFTLSLEKKAQRKIEASVNQHASFSPVPPKSALCQVVLWTESVFFKFIVRALTAKVLCFEKGSNFLGPHGL